MFSCDEFRKLPVEERNYDTSLSSLKYAETELSRATSGVQQRIPYHATPSKGKDRGSFNIQLRPIVGSKSRAETKEKAYALVHQVMEIIESWRFWPT